MSGAAGTIKSAAGSDMSRQCLHDHDLDLSASVRYAQAISLSHELKTKSVTVDTNLSLQKCRFCGEEMPVTEKFLQMMADRMLSHLKPETADVVRKDLELYLTACISCRQKYSVKWNTPPEEVYMSLSGTFLKKSPWVYHAHAGGCNGCDLEILASFGPRYDLERLGIKLVASPRFADILLVTGPVPLHTKTVSRTDLCPDSEPEEGGCHGGLRVFWRGVL